MINIQSCTAKGIIALKWICPQPHLKVASAASSKSNRKPRRCLYGNINVFLERGQVDGLKLRRRKRRRKVLLGGFHIRRTHIRGGSGSRNAANLRTNTTQKCRFMGKEVHEISRFLVEPPCVFTFAPPSERRATTHVPTNFHSLVFILWTKRRQGVKNSQNYVDVIYRDPLDLRRPSYGAHWRRRRNWLPSRKGGH